MTRPYIISHIMSSVDGRIVCERWSDPFDGKSRDDVESVYAEVKTEQDADGWILGSNTVVKDIFPCPYTGSRSIPIHSTEPFIGEIGSKRKFIVFDSQGRICYDSSKVGADNIIVVLGNGVGEEYLQHLRSMGISYLFAGTDGRDYEKALHILAETFGMKKVLLDGGATLNGTFLKLGLIDELSLLIYPGIDGKAGVLSIYEYKGDDDYPAKGQSLQFISSENRRDGVMWLRYKFIKPTNNL